MRDGMRPQSRASGHRYPSATSRLKLHILREDEPILALLTVKLHSALRCNVIGASSLCRGHLYGLQRKAGRGYETEHPANIHSGIYYHHTQRITLPLCKPVPLAWSVARSHQTFVPAKMMFFGLGSLFYSKCDANSPYESYVPSTDEPQASPPRSPFPKTFTFPLLFPHYPFPEPQPDQFLNPACKARARIRN